MKKKVTIIIPCKNYEKYVGEAIQSALNQSLRCEIIVVDDGSTDNSKEVIQKYKKQGVIYKYRKSTGTAAAARNYALKFATGEYLLPLDADDTLYENYAEIASRYLDANPDFDIFAPYAITYNEDEPERSGRVMTPQGLTDAIKSRNTVLYCSMFRATMLDDIGPYDADIPYSGWEDWELWYRAYLAEKKMYVHTKPLFRYRIHNKSMTHYSIYPHIGELVAWMRKKHGIPV
jgi:glycosyltransferase involved in cell wall biosynthesis